MGTASLTSIVSALQDVEVDLPANRVTIAGRVVEAATRAELHAKLSEELYEFLHTGESSDGADLPGFPDHLAAAVPHKYTRVRALVHSVDKSGNAIVEIEKVRVRVSATAVRGAAVGEITEIDIGCTRPSLSPGFFVADGSQGHGLTAADPTLRVYVHLTEPVTATAAWRSTLTQLEALQVPYRSKISLRLPRRDAMVLYLGRQAWPSVPGIAEELAVQQGLGQEISAYAHRLADGVALAWDPDDRRPGRAGLSFGEHRSLAVADALLSPEPREQALAQSLIDGNIDSCHLFRNRTSPAL
jgi:hypothetical protein